MSAPAPSRPSGKFSLSFGLLNVPVSVYTGTEEVRVKRSEYTRDGAKVGNEKRIKNEDGTYGGLVDRSEIVKKYDTGDGLVDLADDEIDALGTVVPGVADILAVQRLAFLNDGTYTSSGQVWQVRAAKLGSGRQAQPNPGGVKAFALLLAALKAEKSFALLRFAKAGTVYHAALLHTGDLIGLYTDEEVRAAVALPEVDLSAAEVDLARQIVGAAKVGKPVALTNELVARVAEYAANKITTGEVVREAPVAAGNVVDLMEQLKASVAAAQAAKVSA